MEFLGVSSLMFILALLASRCETGCEPNIAGRCFENFLLSLDGLLDQMSRVPPRGIGQEVNRLCRRAHEATQCKDDVPDDCRVKGGDFQLWKKAFEDIHSTACNGDISLLRGLLRGYGCWEMTSFLRCASNVTGIWSVEDLAPLETHKCMSGVEDSLHECADRAYNKCSGEVDYSALRRLVSVFYSTALCPNSMEHRSGSASLASLSIVASVLCVFIRVQ
ncbi:uncharacterized protein LOC135388180 [Ornithodoros turicata]|uniref:uncharacterized protein LOC135388180 n=1 Tax=Ornithodoros turicata TaxID=34597 RepID=UPI00313A45BD